MELQTNKNLNKQNYYPIRKVIEKNYFFSQTLLLV